MPTTLTNGIQLPDKGSVDWYSSMQSNYNLIDTHLGDTDVHVTTEDKANWNSKQGSLSQAQLDAIAQVATNTDDIATLQSGKADASHTHSSSDITDIEDYATKDYVDNSISGLVDNAPDALNTLNELSAALNDDSNFASTVTTALGAKANSADLATVATSGSYTDLDDLPTIPTNTSDLTNDSDFVVSSNLATVATSGDYDDLSNKPTINDSTITIQKNGSTVDSFTTNGSAKTINIPVPTKTSDLTNDSGFLTSHQSLSSCIKNNVTNNQNIKSTGITRGTAPSSAQTFGIAFSDNNNKYIGNIYGIFATDMSTSVGLYAYKGSTTANSDNIFIRVGYDASGNAYTYAPTPATTDNSTQIATTAFVKAHDSNVVHKSGDENVGGDKNFQGLLTTIPSSSLWPTVSNTTNDITTLDRSVIHIEYKASGQLTDLSGGAWNVAELGYGCFFFRVNSGTDIRYKNLATGDVNRIPVVSGANRFINDVTPNQDNTYNLGSSSLRWKTINGLNPSSLGMPDFNNGIDISSYITDLTGASNINKYTPPVNGWISIGISNAEFIELYVPTLLMGGTFTKSTANNNAQAFMPVVANKEVKIALKGSSIGWAKFFPCQGNV